MKGCDHRKNHYQEA